MVDHYGGLVHPERRQDKGPGPKPRWRPLPGLLYAQVVNQYRRQRRVGMQHRVVGGPLGAIEHVVAVCGWQSHTALGERWHLACRSIRKAEGYMTWPL